LGKKFPEDINRNSEKRCIEKMRVPSHEEDEKTRKEGALESMSPLSGRYEKS